MESKKCGNVAVIVILIIVLSLPLAMIIGCRGRKESTLLNETDNVVSLPFSDKYNDASSSGVMQDNTSGHKDDHSSSVSTNATSTSAGGTDPDSIDPSEEPPKCFYRLFNPSDFDRAVPGELILYDGDPSDGQQFHSLYVESYEEGVVETFREVNSQEEFVDLCVKYDQGYNALYLDTGYISEYSRFRDLSRADDYYIAYQRNQNIVSTEHYPVFFSE